MTDILKRAFAPITGEAWEEIDGQAKISLKGNLSARAVVDFSGPHGWKLASVNTGSIKLAEKQIMGVGWGIREVLPLVEIRVPFSLNSMNLDDVSRGLKSPDLDEVHFASEKAARFEEQAVYHGFKEAGIKGILELSENKSVPLPKEAVGFPEAIEAGIVEIQRRGIAGPYDLILGSETYEKLMAGDEKGYPVSKRVASIIGGEVRWSPVLKGGVIISKRGGDFELTVGQDFSIGYAGHDKDKVELYITESFTFQVFEPNAAVELKQRA